MNLPGQNEPPRSKCCVLPEICAALQTTISKYIYVLVSTVSVVIYKQEMDINLPVIWLQ